MLFMPEKVAKETIEELLEESKERMREKELKRRKEYLKNKEKAENLKKIDSNEKT